MKKSGNPGRMLALALVLMMVLALFPALEASAAPPGYNENDFNKLQAFLNQDSAEAGQTNGQALNPAYDPDDPATWTSVTWTDVGGEQRVTRIDWGNEDLAGSLDLSDCEALEYLDCTDNALTALTVSGCTVLEELNCEDNQLTSLDVSGLTALAALECRDNQLTDLDVSGCTTLTVLACSRNQLTELDLSDCTALGQVRCEENALTALDVSDLTALEELYCSDNQLAALDVSDLTALEVLNCSGNNLTALNVSGLTELDTLNCSENDLTVLDVSSLTVLYYLACDGNQLNLLDVSGCTELDTLLCNGNLLEALDVSTCAALATLDCSGNLLEELDVTAVTLDYLDVQNNPLVLLTAQMNGAVIELEAQGSGTVGLFYMAGLGAKQAVATPDIDSSFLNWTDDADGGAVESILAAYDLDAGTDYDLTANFAPDGDAGDILIADIAADPATLPSAGGDSVITITGNNLTDGITVTAFDGATPTAITGTTAGSVTEQAVTLTFPANGSTTTDKVYNVRLSRDGGATWEEGRSVDVTVQKSGLVILVPTPPTVVTGAVINITTSDATLSGEVTDDGGAEVTERGFLYGTAPDPAVGGADVVQLPMGMGTGSFTMAITSLSPGTIYHVRAYAVNNQGTAYGGDETFTTLTDTPPATPPTATTGPVSGITSSGATLFGSVMSDGGATVTERGFVYGSDVGPAIGDAGVTKVAVGSGTGDFSTTLTSLSVSTTYHVRAYATHDMGTSYGGDEAFTTLSGGGGDGGGGGGGGSSSGTQNYYATVMKNKVQVATLPITVASGKNTGTVSLTGAQAAEFLAAGADTVILVPPVPGVNCYNLEMPANFGSEAQAADSLAFETPFGSISIPDNMLAGLNGTEGKKAGIAIGQGDRSKLSDSEKAAIGDRPLIQLTLTLDGVQTDWNNPAAPITVAIPYTPTAAELQNPEYLIIWYLDGSGNLVCVPNGRYDATTGTVTFTTAHFSLYAVGYNPVSFRDVEENAWYNKAVSFIAARGIITGTGSGNYSPEARLTRSEFIVMLMRTYGIAPDTNPQDNFSDAGNTWYTNYLAAAKRSGISAGVGGNRFAPGREITRQEMFTLLYNALKAMGQLPEGNYGKPLASFSDAGNIAPWAIEAMTRLVESGIVGGSGGKLCSEETTTRAEMAQVLYKLLLR
ncbi:MAG: hypothetical protein HPY50_18095 [Firmicutes bacterium]|nr:hypothetical protein [Bacillota bacterium]